MERAERQFESKESQPKKRWVQIRTDEIDSISYDILEVPAEMDLNKEKEMFLSWRKESPYNLKSFVQWLEKRGAKEADIETVDI